MKTVYFVRHGEAENNIGAPVYRGQQALLTPKGTEQAEVVARRFKKIPVDVIISSPWKRTRQTADIVAAHSGHTVEEAAVFGENAPPSSFIGRPRNEMIADERAWRQTFFTDGAKYEDGENFAEIKARCGDALRYLEGRPEENILVVTHGFFLRTLLAYLLVGPNLTSKELERFHMVLAHTKNSHITIFHYDETDEQSKWQLYAWNDHAHLG